MTGANLGDSTKLRYQVRHLAPLFREQQELLDELAGGNEVAAIRLRTKKDLPDYTSNCTVRFDERRRVLVVQSNADMPAMLIWCVKFDAGPSDSIHLDGMKLNGPVHGGVRMYWSTSCNPDSFSEKQAVTTHFLAEGKCEIGENPLWRGRIRALRFDFYPQGHEYEFGSVTIRPGGRGRVVRNWAGETKAGLGQSWCAALPMLAPSTCSIRLQVPAGARLRGRTGCADASAHVRFRLGIAPPHAEPTWLLNRESVGGLDKWEPFEVDLAPFAGLETELILRGEIVRRDGRSRQQPLLLWGNLRMLVPESDPKPDVVLVSLDALRRDHLGAYGRTPSLTPTLDRLAESAVVCERSITAGTQTLLSHTSLFCGCTPDEHGVLEKEGHCQPQHGIRPLAELLARAGYQTVALTDSAFMDVTFQGVGFSVYTHNQINPFASQLDRSPYRSDEDLAESLRLAASLLDEHGGERLLFFLHTFYVHDYYADFTSHSSAPSIEEGSDVLSRLVPVLNEQFCFVPDEVWERLRRCYSHRVRQLDEGMSKLINLLDRRDRYGEALLVVFADHGEDFGEHGGAVHGHSVRWELTDVPLIVKFPGGEFSGRRLSTPTSLIDVLPTVMDATGLEVPAWVTGQSLKKMLNGTAKASARRVVTSTAVAKEDVRALSAQTARAKYICLCTRGLEEVYDLERDPLERDNLLVSAPERVDGEFLHRCRELTIERLRRPWGWHMGLRAKPGETLSGRLTFERPPWCLATLWAPGDFVKLSADRRVLIFHVGFHNHREKALFFRTTGPFEACLKLNYRDLPAERLWLGAHGKLDRQLVGPPPLAFDEAGMPPGVPDSYPPDRAVVVWRVASPQEGEPPSAEAPPHVIAQLKALGYVD